jgi:hypothetical protein
MLTVTSSRTGAAPNFRKVPANSGVFTGYYLMTQHFRGPTRRSLRQRQPRSIPPARKLGDCRSVGEILVSLDVLAFSSSGEIEIMAVARLPVNFNDVNMIFGHVIIIIALLHLHYYYHHR